jgi:hypothetical protein
MPKIQIFPTWTPLNQANSASSSGQTDLRTGLALQGGNLVLGDYCDLTESEANALSYTTTGTLHAGRYRWIQVDSAATAANVKTGTMGLMTSLALGVNNITSADKGYIGSGINGAVGRAVVFLNSITPGNYGFVQELGDASVLMGTASGNAGTPVYGTVAAGLGASANTNAVVLGEALETLGNTALKRVLLNLPVVQG